MFQKCSMAKHLVLAIMLGASSLLAQQAQPTGITPPKEPSATEAMAKGRMDGNTSAQAVGTGGWVAGGVVTGVLTGLIGTAIIYVVAANSDVSVPAAKKVEIANENATYQQAYEAGFGDKLKSKRKSSALVGGLLGTAFLVAIVASSSGSQ